MNWDVKIKDREKQNGYLETLRKFTFELLLVAEFIETGLARV